MGFVLWPSALQLAKMVVFARGLISALVPMVGRARRARRRYAIPHASTVGLVQRLTTVRVLRVGVARTARLR